METCVNISSKYCKFKLIGQQNLFEGNCLINIHIIVLNIGSLKNKMRFSFVVPNFYLEQNQMHFLA